MEKGNGAEKSGENEKKIFYGHIYSLSILSLNVKYRVSYFESPYKNHFRKKRATATFLKLSVECENCFRPFQNQIRFHDSRNEMRSCSCNFVTGILVVVKNGNLKYFLKNFKISIDGNV